MYHIIKKNMLYNTEIKTTLIYLCILKTNKGVKLNVEALMMWSLN